MKAKTARRFLARNKWKLAVARLNDVVNSLVWREAKAINALKK